MKGFILLSLITLVSSSLNCPSSQWSRFGNKCYFTNESLWVNYGEYLAFCESFNATPVSIHSEKENDFVKTSFNGPGYSYWIGLGQIDYEKKTYEWLDESPYNYSNWPAKYGIEPCVGLLCKSNTDCFGAYVFHGKWKVSNCLDSHFPICQIDLERPLPERFKTLEHWKNKTEKFTGSMPKVSCKSNETFRYRNKCFLTETSMKYTFDENDQFCKSKIENATSVSILSEEENEFLQAKLDRFRGYWLGMRQVNFDNRTYEWLDGSNFSYYSPVFLHSERRKKCSGAYFLSGIWIDRLDCDDRNAAFCQVEIHTLVGQRLAEVILAIVQGIVEAFRKGWKG